MAGHLLKPATTETIMASQNVESHNERKPGVYKAVVDLLRQEENKGKFRHIIRKTVQHSDTVHYQSARPVGKASLTTPHLKPKPRQHPDSVVWKRSLMGHFLFDVGAGEEPLTVRDLPVPGPADYDPDYKKSSRQKKEPEYSFRSWTKPASSDSAGPGPIYNTRQSSTYLEFKQIKIKGKNHISVHHEKTKAGPGPGAYAVDYETISHKEHDLKPTIKGKMTSKYWPGFLSGLEMACEAPDFVSAVDMVKTEKTCKSSAFGDSPKWSFSGRPETSTLEGPAPGSYDLPPNGIQQRPPPGKTFGSYLPPASPTEDSPGPGAYLVPLYDKPKDPKAIIFSRHLPRNVKQAPAPNEYVIKGNYDKLKKDCSGRGPHVTFRQNSDSSERGGAAGPSDYMVRTEQKILGGAMPGHSKAPYPDCLNYKPYIKDHVATPGSATYNPTNHCIGRHSAGKSFGRKISAKEKPEIAGPGDYNIRGLTACGPSTIPSVSLTGEIQSTGCKGGGGSSKGRQSKAPAPSDYNTSTKFDGPSFSMGGSTKSSKLNRNERRTDGTPGPQYNLRGLTRTGPHFTSNKQEGIVMKSRGSPHIYQGIPDSRTKPPVPLPFAPQRWHDSVKLG